MRIMFLLALSALGFSMTNQNSIKVSIAGFAQGTTYHITYYAPDSNVVKKNVDSLLNSIDSSLSIYKPYSLISLFNQSEKGLKINEHFVNVVNKSLETFTATKGLFDITIAPLVYAWGFGARKNNALPDSAAVASLRQCVNSNFLHLQGNFLGKDKPCVQVDVNGIAQGYSVDVVAAFLEAHNIYNYVVEIGGEIRVKGKKNDGSMMKIGIEAPVENELDPEIIQHILEIDSGAVTTSGNYRKYFESEGKKITHLIDPRTGYSVQNEMISVTVYATDAITADAYDNALMLMGVDSALNFVNNRKDLAAYMIYKRKNGTVADTATAAFYRLLKK
ncbi:FAD:protein FMN transferase [Foetidibacter luteolus]|uniref:FAD:protein FMN transferase n=1 Tax=Foetidibacter luteolus TaxID=2608880 RepID=UPI00129BE99E|nr:FAD:protein FMN transferase [Foetidibacter luteolus]